MKKYKFIILILFIILLTGCSGTYKVSINNDLSVNEELKTYLENSDNTYDNTLKLFEENKVSPDKYKIVLDDKKIKITYKDSYDSIEDYLLNSNIYRIMYDNIDFYNNNKKLTIKTYPSIKLDKTYSTLTVNDLSVSKFDVIINTPLNISNNNADKVNKNEYIWNYKNRTTDKNIMLEIDLNKRAEDYKYIIVISSIVILSLAIFIYLIRKFKNIQKI